MFIPKRCDVLPENCWNLNKLYISDNVWKKDLELLIQSYKKISDYENTIQQSAQHLCEILDAYMHCNIRVDNLGVYAMLKLQEDLSNSTSNARYTRFLQIQAEYIKLTSFIIPSIHKIDCKVIKEWCEKDCLHPYKDYILRIIRYKPHTLSAREESLLAPLSEVFHLPNQAFSALTDVDMNFGSIIVNGEIHQVTQSSFSSLLKNQDALLRKKVYYQFYSVYEQHQNLLAVLYAGNLKQDIYNANVRNFKSTLESALFPDNIPESVYDNLIKSVRSYLPVLHSYYEIRRKYLKVEKLAIYDIHVPLTPSVDIKYTYNDAVDLICKAMIPLGNEYCHQLREGLTKNWVDKYENQSKCSGAFSSGSYQGDPYILINYRDNDIRLLFTLAHEAGHSMHSLYSVKNNTYQDYSYSIFEAEIASTCNEALLFEYLYNQTEDKERKLFLISERIVDLISTLFRQTMFAEFEKQIHHDAMHNEPPTLEYFRKIYRKLLTDYFGPNVEITDLSDLECLRIPHFYRSFYVYKYATGLATSLTLCQKLLKGDDLAQKNYLQFLKNGGRFYPLENLKRTTGLDLQKSETLISALEYFKTLVQLLEELYSNSNK